MRVTLVYAGISETGFNKTGSRLKLVWIHHGLAALASCLKKDGHEVSLIDLRQVSSWDEFRGRVEECSPQVAGVTMMSVDYTPATEAIGIIKSVSGRIKVVVGGAHPSLALEEVVDDDRIDCIVQGEGEISFNGLLKDIETNKTPPRVISGIKPVVIVVEDIQHRLKCCSFIDEFLGDIDRSVAPLFFHVFTFLVILLAT